MADNIVHLTVIAFSSLNIAIAGESAFRPRVRNPARRGNNRTRQITVDGRQVYCFNQLCWAT